VGRGGRVIVGGGKGEEEGERNHIISLFGGESRHIDRVTSSLSPSPSLARSLARARARSLTEEEEGETISGEMSVHSILVARNFSGSCFIKLVLKHYLNAFVLALYLSLLFF
jgi:hypothetical protein